MQQNRKVKKKYPKTDRKIPLQLGQRTDVNFSFRKLSLFSDIDIIYVFNYFSRKFNAGNAEHSDSNTRSVMKNPKITRKYPKALSFILKVPWCSILCDRWFSSRPAKYHFLNIILPILSTAKAKATRVA